jgi:thiamine biosynthesis lipoprotein
VQDISAVWVSADDAMSADGLATALFFTTPDKLLPLFDFSYLILHSDATAERSANFPAELFVP